MKKPSLRLALTTAIGFAVATTACADTSQENLNENGQTLVESLNLACDDLETEEGYNACKQLYQATAAQLRDDVLGLFPSEGRMSAMLKREETLLAGACDAPFPNLSFEQEYYLSEAGTAIARCNSGLQGAYDRAVIANANAEDADFDRRIAILAQVTGCFMPTSREDRQAAAVSYSNGEIFFPECNIEEPQLLAN